MSRSHVKKIYYIPRGCGRDSYVFRDEHNLYGTYRQNTKYDIYNSINIFWEKHDRRGETKKFTNAEKPKGFEIGEPGIRDTKPTFKVQHRISGYAGHIPNSQITYGRSTSSRAWEDYMRRTLQEKNNQSAIYKESYKPSNTSNFDLAPTITPRKIMNSTPNSPNSGSNNAGKSYTKFVSPVRNAANVVEKVPPTPYPLVRKSGYAGHIPQNPRVCSRIKSDYESFLNVKSKIQQRTTWKSSTI